MNMKKIKISRNCILLEFPTKKEMNLSMFRIAEFYESDSEKIRGKFFSFDEFVEHYSDESGNLDYFARWDGFNVPIKVLDSFEVEFFFELSKREDAVLHAVRNLSGNGYLIACVKGDKMTKKHELAHYFFSENKEYENSASMLVKNLPGNLKKSIIRNLKKIHYSDDVLIDEINSYFTAFDFNGDKEVWDGISLGRLLPHVKAFKNLYSKVSK